MKAPDKNSLRSKRRKNLIKNGGPAISKRYRKVLERTDRQKKQKERGNL